MNRTIRQPGQIAGIAKVENVVGPMVRLRPNYFAVKAICLEKRLEALRRIVLNRERRLLKSCPRRRAICKKRGLKRTFVAFGFN
jgi:hypothetical protein